MIDWLRTKFLRFIRPRGRASKRIIQSRRFPARTLKGTRKRPVRLSARIRRAPLPAAKSTSPVVVAAALPASGPSLARTVRKSFFLRPRADGVPDILDAIQFLGGIRSPTASKFAGQGDYDGFREAFTGPARVLIRRSGGMRPDELVQALTDEAAGAGQTFRLENGGNMIRICG